MNKTSDVEQQLFRKVKTVKRRLNMHREDHGLAELLKYENIAWYEDGVVRILDRRVYPYEKKTVECRSHQEVAQAITDMVTQSGGPFLAVQMGMALASHEAKDRPVEERMAYLAEAARTLSQARPTTAEKLRLMTDRSLAAAHIAMENGRDLTSAIVADAIETINRRYHEVRLLANHLAAQFPDQGVVMTQCFGETIVGMMLLACRGQGKTVRFICPETRPFLQGARLTASVIADMGFEVHVITDNMPAWIMAREQVDVLTSAADIITMDGHVVNKVGTFQLALAAAYHNIPYFVTGTPNFEHESVESIVIEERDVEQVKTHLGRSVVREGVNAYYPAFDITPPKLVNGVVTPKGIFSPYDLKTYYGEGDVSTVVV